MTTKSQKIGIALIILLILITIVFAVLFISNKNKTNNENEVTTETTTTLLTKPSTKHSVQKTSESTTEQTIKHTTESIAKQTTKHTIESTTKQTIKQTTESATKQTTKPITVNPSDKIPVYYSEIVTQCKNAIRNDFYKDYSNKEIEKIKGKYLPYSVLGAVTEFNAEPKIYYALHDIDKNGIPEMFIATKNNNNYTFQDIFTYADRKIYSIFGEYFNMNYVDIYSNGTIVSYSSDEECKYWDFMQLSKNGHTLEKLDSIYIYNSNGKVKYMRLIDSSSNTNNEAEPAKTEISKEKFDSIGKIYTGQAPKELNKKINSQSDINFEWKEIE